MEILTKCIGPLRLRSLFYYRIEFLLKIPDEKSHNSEPEDNVHVKTVSTRPQEVNMSWVTVGK